jgi:hypothetical protein
MKNRCVSRNLVNRLPETALRLPPLREVITVNSNRIDLLLQGKTGSLYWKYKIFHGQINPFAEYEIERHKP